MQGEHNQSSALREELLKLFEKARMPSSPHTAARILELIEDPNATAACFAEAVRTDPALATQLLRTVNTVHYAQRSPVTTLERAVTVLGLVRVKTLCLGFQLIGHLDRLGGVPFDMKKFWQQSLLRACLARGLAQRVIPHRGEEAFLIGLLQDCGILLLVQAQGERYSNLYRDNPSPTVFHAREQASFPHTHVDAISAMASVWRLPDIIATPLSRHHERVVLGESAADEEKLIAISYFVGGLCFGGDGSAEQRLGSESTPNPSVGATAEARGISEEASLADYASTQLGIGEDVWAVIQKQASDDFMRMSTLYAEVLPEEVDTAQLLSEANRQLASLAEQADLRVREVETQHESTRQKQHQLQDALADYRERASVDPLTNVANRGAVMDAARRAIENNLDEGVPVGVLFLDIDNFKRLNDTFGHRTGDNVLKVVASSLEANAGDLGTVGRYGGEEFVIVLPGISVDDTKRLAEEMVRRMRAIDPKPLGVTGTITCSVGGYWTNRLTDTSAESLFAAADRKMYEAKKSGKDRCCVQIDEDPSANPAKKNMGAVDSLIAETLIPPVGDASGRNRLAYLLSIAKRLNVAEDANFDGIRKQERKSVEIPCVLHVFTQTGDEVRALQAVTRSISSGGAGLVVARPMVRGEAVEITLDRGTETTFVAGLVAFCRHVEDGIHEIGVQFVTHSVRPIISESPAASVQDLDWVAQALRRVQSADSPTIAAR